eukprot:Hpha_TRINITY_DN22733_c0_g1::TRINITY_DN22733_c0_g1_i1::g.34154::m.34154
MRCCSLTTVLLFVTVLAAWSCGMYMLLGDVIELTLQTFPEDSAPGGLKSLHLAYKASGGKEGGGAEVIAGALRAKLWNQVSGPPDALSRRAWHRLLDSLRTASEVYLSPTHAIAVTRNVAKDAAELAEGHHYLTHLLRVGFEAFVENSPLHPRFIEFVNARMKLQGDNPDARYFWAPLSPTRRYIIQGKLRGESYLSFSVHSATSPGSFGAKVTSEVNHRKLPIGADGSYTVVLAPATAPVETEEEGVYVLRMDKEAVSVVSRHYFEYDIPAALNASTIPELSIQTDPQLAPQDSPIGDEALATRIDQVTTFVREHSHGKALPAIDTAPAWFSLVPNVFGAPTRWSGQSEGMGAVDIHYAAGPFSLGPGEGLLVSGVMPPCAFGNLVLWNRFLQTFDYTARDRPVSLNRKQLRPHPETGKFRFVIAPHDPQIPGVPWVYNERRPRGTVFFRYLLSEVDHPEAPVGKIILLANASAEARECENV